MLPDQKASKMLEAWARRANVPIGKAGTFGSRAATD